MHFYPRSPCGERLNDAINGCNPDFISIHALLAESDTSNPARAFLISYFYPRSPCGERPPRGDSRYLDNIISIHALLAESDVMRTLKLADTMLFLSTLSLRRATYDASALMKCQVKFLSTLSLRRATSQQPDGTTRTTYFYPRSPCGERPMISETVWLIIVFLSTLSLRRATVTFECYNSLCQDFYPRSPCGERH